MQLEDLSLVTRPRSHYEAMDLGFTMVRHWWRSVYMAWLLASLPIFIAACVLLRDAPEYIGLVIWWFKPFYDRLVLHVIGARVFGATPTFRELLRFVPRTLKVDLLLHLTIRRYDMSRSFRLPVLILEGLRGKPYRARYRLLCQNVLGRAHLLSFACITIEQCLTIGLLGVAYLLIPPSLAVDLEDLTGVIPVWLSYSLALIYYLAVSLVEPPYVGGGFALYLNRRTLLEGWDLELGLRRMARRLEDRPIGTVAACLGTALLLGVLCASPGQVMAQATPADDAVSESDPNWVGEPRDAGEAGEVARAVLANEDFSTSTTVTSWFDFGDFDWGDLDEDEAEDDPRELTELGAIVAQFIEGLLWVCLIAGVAWLLYKLIPLARSARIERLTPEASGPDVRSGQTEYDDTVGPDALRRALECHRNGDLRGALSLLYRSAIEQIGRRHRLTVPDGATERDLLELARAAAPAEVTQMLRGLLQAWQRVVYADKSLSDTEFEGIVSSWRAAMEPGA